MHEMGWPPATPAGDASLLDSFHYHFETVGMITAVKLDGDQTKEGYAESITQLSRMPGQPAGIKIPEYAKGPRRPASGAAKRKTLFVLVR
jgi:hypothetical protein